MLNGTFFSRDDFLFWYAMDQRNVWDENIAQYMLMTQYLVRNLKYMFKYGINDIRVSAPAPVYFMAEYLLHIMIWYKAQAITLDAALKTINYTFSHCYYIFYYRKSWKI
ncbi:hypothetical protein XENTR_v10007979 [Xenopus tropicalis]|nr:hypothetical protein XENTR_v10007979 [Xenopus tropicalis]